MLTPYLTVHDARAAIDFYAAAFGAVETGERYEEDGRIGFVALAIDGAALYLSDEAHEYGAWAPRSAGHATAAIALGVADADAVYARAVAAGATVDREPSDQGDERRGWLVDPFGHRWVIASPLVA
ncbi:VOC family protein [Cellulomonas wangsupingiae]|uniref:VOC family protein n=1 Tax=Cellulomonas wangsupingiae TaxID=2968085 RepID=A0ABY5K994_9CELL|nr:VOC family protein [Cellulomonas wangsupingiae]MCC2334049.1 VOC family protein [Cellulomonas wangsupingiae]MCM0641072.1 VOC family protein [Cellulomonas wangsupingiae]UUI66920.1 VOC family protein [Cellulomonas wangsupingiae]